MTDNGGLQLLSNQGKSFQLASISGDNTLLYASLALIIVLGGAYGFFWFRTSSAMADIAVIDQELTVIQQARNKQSEARIVNLKKQLTIANTLIAKHLRWSEALLTLNHLIHPRVVVQSLTADSATHAYNINATADSFTTVARQIAAFYGSADITGVSLTSVNSQTNGQVSFTASVKFNPAGLIGTPQPTTP